MREAIIQANTADDVDTIVFDSQVFSTPKTITLTSGQLAPFYSVIIEGPGADLLTISGNNQSRIFFNNLSSSELTIKNLTLTGGFAANGGAIYTGNSLKLSNLVITGNKAMGAEVTGDGFPGALGGGIYSTGGLTLTDSIISNNLASGVVIITANPNVGDAGSAGGGGGIFSPGVAPLIVNCTFINNMAKGAGSPTAPAGKSGAQGGAAYGGAYYGSSGSRVINSTFINNSAVAGSGGSIVSTGFGLTAGAGGPAFGGAIYARPFGGISILNTTVADNSVAGGNGGNAADSSAAGNGAIAFGGGIYDEDLRIANTTVVNNTVVAGSGRNGANARGGGIYGGSNQWSIINSTITGNAVTGGTGTQNNGLGQGGGVFSSPNAGPASSFRNNIVAENSAGSAGADVFGNFINAFNNLIRNGDGSTGITNGVNGNLVGTANSQINPMLGSLADNGGVTKTRALLPGSPAVNAGNNAFAVNPLNSQPLRFDQRNLQRVSPAGGTVDMGAFELGSTSVPTTASPNLQNGSDTGFNNTDNITRSRAPVFDVSNVIPGARIELLRNNMVVSSVSASFTSASLTDPAPPLDAVVQYTSRQVIGGVTSEPSPAPLTVTFDNTSPTVTINQASTQPDPATTLPVRFTAVFNEPVVGFSETDVSLSGSTANVASAFITVMPNNTIYSIAVSNISSNGGFVRASIDTNAASDLAGNLSLASTSTDNQVTLDNISPSVTINQAAGQVDPASAQPINFTVVFSEPVAGFNASDISFTGSTANVAFANVTVTGGGGTYNVAVSNITSNGQVRARVLAGAAQDAFGNPSGASTSTDNTVTVNLKRAQFDYDGDGRTDLSVFRPSAGSWYISRSSDNAFAATQFGANGDLIAPADFDGDGKTDICVFRPSDGGWYRLNSSNNTFTPAQFGTNGDLPVPGDFDGDGKADLTVYRPSAGTWFRINSSNSQFVAVQFGVAEDKPLVGDFDGDGKSDLTVFRPSNGTWYRINSATDTFSPNQFGAPGDLPVAADYDGDGKSDLAVYRPSVGDWYIVNSSNAAFTSTHFGVTEDKPAPADFDGDGKADLVVFRPSSGTWYLLRTSAGFTGIQFGADGDIPTPNAMVR
ncbi:MAG TPA: FG-GAP-like repeat-containing protein [Pyrinomonadaceae bacterium]|nr:FG-GAP-like repeat-containing protein [Pyrinomonadaceae bacterium]